MKELVKIQTELKSPKKNLARVSNKYSYCYRSLEDIQEDVKQGFRQAQKARRAGRDAFVGSLFGAASKAGKAASKGGAFNK